MSVHYQRPDGNYDGWGLHLWGDALGRGGGTDYSTPRLPDGVDEFGAYWDVPIDDASARLQLHRPQPHAPGGDVKDPAADLTLVPAEQADAWIVSGDPTVYESRAEALDLAVLHYARPGGDFGDYASTNFVDYWSLYTWTGAAAPSPSWPESAKPTRADRFGQVWEVPLTDTATTLNYILHRGDRRTSRPTRCSTW